MWKMLSCSFSELNLDVTLAAGQSFRWSKSNNGEWFGVISDFVCALKQDTKGNLLYKIHNSAKSDDSYEQSKPDQKRPSKRPKTIKNISTQNNNLSYINHEDILNDYFNLNFNLEDHYNLWSKADENFKSVGKIHKGIRILRQDPVENLFSFICSANNNIPRITGMVGKLCSNYGEKLLQIDDQTFYTFPTIERLAADDVENKLRTLGFGYRAKYINQTAKILLKEKPPGWLENLRKISYKEAHEELLTLPGVGAKVADCVCLMSLDKYDAIPVDTHIWQVTLKDYMPHLKNSKTLTHKIYQEIGDFYRERFGKYAGWANTVLFANDLKMFKNNKD
ncbi:N-glycosylase/DNA lyase like protein [Argiope bruennichi]|uniref:N-glycosylase/DNA lyase n=1 Tax=Argiope bruennichi TaxID=94029 RepID=A0A8T0DY44_ARGBR|nr:N-glycosylase/DNA lyase like protein [Argiope bruennichi]